MGYIFSLSIRWGSSQSIFFATDHYIIIFGLFLVFFFLRPDLTHSYPTHLPTFISIVLTLVPYYLSFIDITILITSYPTDLTTIPTTYLTNLATMLTTYPTDLTIVLTTYPIDINTLQT
jgi:hypothetical protein